MYNGKKSYKKPIVFNDFKQSKKIFIKTLKPFEKMCSKLFRESLCISVCTMAAHTRNIFIIWTQKGKRLYTVLYALLIFDVISSIAKTRSPLKYLYTMTWPIGYYGPLKCKHTRI